MTITPQTRISEIVKQKKESIGVIASLAKPLEKLRNPILRKVMASRVTLADAARMGGCRLSDMVHALEKLGFTYLGSTKGDEEQMEKPKWLIDASENKVVWFDARPVLNKGQDPLKEILAAFRKVKPDELFAIITGFVPVPLIGLLKQKQGVDAYVDKVAPFLYHTYFHISKSVENRTSTSATEGPVMHDKESFVAMKKRFSDGHIQFLDVRHLEMPLPMQTILAALPNLPAGKALHVQHKRIPVYLLEEMASMNYAVHIYQAAEGEVELLIFSK